MSQYFESIRLINGRVMNLKYHQERVDRTFLMGNQKAISLRKIIKKESLPKKGIYKIRISYSILDSAFIRLEITEYNEKVISSLQLVEYDEMNYKYKAEDRSELDGAFAQKKIADDVIIVVNGKLTDTWYCNIALWNGKSWDTPKDCLLHGTMREKLIRKSIVHPVKITLEDLSKYSKVRLFNAMIPWSQKKDISLEKVYLPL